MTPGLDPNALGPSSWTYSTETVTPAPAPTTPPTSSTTPEQALAFAQSLEAQAAAYDAQNYGAQASALRQQAAAIRSNYGLPAAQPPAAPAPVSSDSTPPPAAPPPPATASSYTAPSFTPAPTTAPASDSSFFSSKDIVGIVKSATSALTQVGTAAISAGGARAQARAWSPPPAPSTLPLFRPGAAQAPGLNKNVLIAAGAGLALLAVIGVAVILTSGDDED